MCFKPTKGFVNISSRKRLFFLQQTGNYRAFFSSWTPILKKIPKWSIFSQYTIFLRSWTVSYFFFGIIFYLDPGGSIKKSFLLFFLASKKWKKWPGWGPETKEEKKSALTNFLPVLNSFLAKNCHFCTQIRLLSINLVTVHQNFMLVVHRVVAVAGDHR